MTSSLWLASKTSLKTRDFSSLRRFAAFISASASGKNELKTPVYQFFTAHRMIKSVNGFLSADWSFAVMLLLLFRCHLSLSWISARMQNKRDFEGFESSLPMGCLLNWIPPLPVSSLSMLADKLNMTPEEAERWIVNLIRNARLDAKIDSKLVRGCSLIHLLSGSPYTQGKLKNIYSTLVFQW